MWNPVPKYLNYLFSTACVVHRYSEIHGIVGIYCTESIPEETCTAHSPNHEILIATKIWVHLHEFLYQPC